MLKRQRTMKRQRTGTTVFEMTVAIVLLMAAVLSATQLIGASVNARRKADRRQLARYEAANLMERVAALPWAEVTNENLQAWPLAEELQKQLPGARLQALVEEVAVGESDTSEKKPPLAALPAKKITLAISWNGPAKSHVRLMSWRYAPPPPEKPQQEDS